MTQYDLADATLSSHESLKELDDIHQSIDRSEIESLLGSLYASNRGKFAFPPLTQFKAMLPQAWYNLSDHTMEKQLARDLLFRRIVDLQVGPDYWIILLTYSTFLAKQERDTEITSGRIRKTKFVRISAK